MLIPRHVGEIQTNAKGQRIRAGRVDHVILPVAERQAVRVVAIPSGQDIVTHSTADAVHRAGADYFIVAGASREIKARPTSPSYDNALPSSHSILSNGLRDRTSAALNCSNVILSVVLLPT